MAPPKRKATKKHLAETDMVVESEEHSNEAAMVVQALVEKTVRNDSSDDEKPLAVMMTRGRKQMGQKLKPQSLAVNKKKIANAGNFMDVNNKTFTVSSDKEESDEHEPTESKGKGNGPKNKKFDVKVQARKLRGMKTNDCQVTDELCKEFNEMKVLSDESDLKHVKRDIKSKATCIETPCTPSKPMSKAQKKKFASIISDDEVEEIRVFELPVTATNEKSNDKIKKQKKKMDNAQVNFQTNDDIPEATNELGSGKMNPLKRAGKVLLPSSTDHEEMEHQSGPKKGKQKLKLQEDFDSGNDLFDSSNELSEEPEISPIKEKKKQNSESEESKQIVAQNSSKKPSEKLTNNISSKKNQKLGRKKLPTAVSSKSKKLVTKKNVEPETKRILKKYPSEDNLRNIATRKIMSKSEENLSVLTDAGHSRPRRAAALKNAVKDSSDDEPGKKKKKILKKDTC